MSKRNIEFSNGGRDLHITNMSDIDRRDLKRVVGETEYRPESLFSDLYDKIPKIPDPVETEAKNFVVVIANHGSIYMVPRPFAIEKPDYLEARQFSSWCRDTGKWTHHDHSGGFDRYTVLYDSADPTVGIPDGTEWVLLHSNRIIVHRYVGGKVYRREGLGSWEPSYIDPADLHKTEFHTRYNPDTTPYTPPAWLTALLNESAPKPLMEEGKFYQPKFGLNSKCIFRKHKGLVQLWSLCQKWVDTAQDFYSPGTPLVEVPNPEPAKPCYIAADGRRIPVGSKFIWKDPESYYADFTVEKPDGTGTWRQRCDNSIVCCMQNLGAAYCLSQPTNYRLELAA